MSRMQLHHLVKRGLYVFLWRGSSLLLRVKPQVDDRRTFLPDCLSDVFGHIVPGKQPDYVHPDVKRLDDFLGGLAETVLDPGIVNLVEAFKGLRPHLELVGNLLISS